ELFAGAGLAGDEHRCVRRCDELDLAQDAADPAALTDDAVGADDPSRTESDLVVQNALWGDVAHQGEHADDAAARVALGQVTGRLPDVALCARHAYPHVRHSNLLARERAAERGLHAERSQEWEEVRRMATEHFAGAHPRKLLHEGIEDEVAQ